MVVSENNKSTLTLDGVQRLHEKVDSHHEKLHQTIRESLDKSVAQIKYHESKTVEKHAELSKQLDESEKHICADLHKIREDIKINFSLNTIHQREILGRLNWLLGIASVSMIGVIGIWVRLLIKHI